MSKRRKQAGKAAHPGHRAPARPAAASSQANGLPQASGSAQELADVPARGSARGITPHPPRKHFLFLLGSALALSLWITFLMAMAYYG